MAANKYFNSLLIDRWGLCLFFLNPDGLAYTVGPLYLWVVHLQIQPTADWKQFLKIAQEQSMVTHACNPSYWGGRKLKDYSLRSAQAKKLWGYNSINIWMQWHPCHPSYTRSINRRITVQASPNIIVKPYLKNNQSKQGWGCDSSSSRKCMALNSNPSTTKKLKIKF
jgi:hypothetical protein